MRKGRSSGGNNNGFLPNSLRIISSCLKTVSTNATTVASSVKSAGVSVASSISAASDDHKEQVIWAGFDKLELSSSVCKHVLLLGYQNGFQVLNVADASNFSELVSRRDDGPVTFLQMQPIPLRSRNHEGFAKSFPLLLVVGGDEINCSVQVQSRGHLSGLEKDTHAESHAGNSVSCSRAVRFYSLKSHSYVHVLRFRSAVCMVRCSPNIVAVGLATQIYCFDALTLENKFSVLTYPVPQLGGQGRAGVNIGYGPMAVGPRWLAYASNDPLLIKTGRLSPQTVNPSPRASPSTSPVSGTGLVAHYAMESSKQLATGIANLGGRGYKTLSKYCQELLPDGPNSLSLNSGSRAGRYIMTGTDNAGVVVVKDFISRAVICQFKAHSTPISALCFDPSGTLVVTASVYGNSINIFRIMPFRNDSGSESESFDWGSSYVHLYKLHRGIRAAVIQDICFSCYSQWIAVVSSKGTCHVFVLSPFGGHVGFQKINSCNEESLTENSYNEEPSIGPVLPLPWWSASSFTNNLKSFSPPSTVTLSVVSRIKDNNFGLLNTVSSAAASVSGKISVPSGALAAVFHNSIPCSPQQVPMSVNSLEHLLVYTPSGHVVQHEIRPPFLSQTNGDSRPNSVSFMQYQDAELSMNIHPVQWWDVCRRTNWPEREDFVSESVVHKQEASVVSGNLISATYGADFTQMNTTTKSLSLKLDLSMSGERSHWYLANAEVQYSRGRLPLWKNSKIAFLVTGPPRVVDANSEYEIEKLPASHVELRQKDLLPVFYHVHSMRSALNDRGISAGRYSNDFSLESSQAKEEVSEETIICHSKPASFSSTDSSDGGLSRRVENLLDLDRLNSDQFSMPYSQNSDEHCGERRASVFGDLPMLDNKLGVTVADTHAPEIKLPKLPSCQNQYLGLDAYTSGTSQTYGDGRILTKVHDSAGIGVLFNEAFCRTLEPIGGQKEIWETRYAPTINNMDFGKDSLVQKEGNFLRPVSTFIAVNGKIEPTKAEEVTKAASNPTTNNNGSGNVNLNQGEQEILWALCDFSGQSCDPTGMKEAISSSINNDFNQNEYNDTDGREDDATRIAAVSTNFSFRKENNKAEDMIGLFEEGPETLEQAGGQRASGTVNTSVFSCNVEEDEALLGAMFAFPEG